MYKKIFALLLTGMAICVYARAQNKFTVQGMVVDSTTKSPITMASIVVKNTPGFGVSADDQGRFLIKVSQYDVLIVSAAGYAEKEYPVVDTQAVVVALSRKNELSDEVVVVGFGTQKRASVVGAVTSVPVSQLRTPTASLVNGLAGNAAGIIAMQRTGEPGQNASQFWIRGIGTFGANAEALVLVDGVQRGSINEIDPDDIESFSILKDASATAVYGVRGANGVVLITTKRGKSGKPAINFRVERGTLTPSRLQEFVRSYDYAKLANEARVVRGGIPVYTGEELDIIKYGLDPDIYPDIDWRDATVKKATSNTMARGSIAGGGPTARYYISLSYYNEQGLYKFDDLNKYNSNVNFKKYTFRSNVDVNVTPTTLINLGMGGNITNVNRPGALSGDIWGSMGTLTPITVPFVYSSGQLPSYGRGNFANPYILLTQTGFANKWDNKVESNLKLTQKLNFITQGLSAHILYSYDAYNLHEILRIKFPELYLAQRQRNPVDGSLILQKKTDATPIGFGKTAEGTRGQYLEGAINYSRVFNQVHSVTGLLLYNRIESISNKATDEISSIPFRSQGLTGRATYGYKSRYQVEANFAYNGSENFEPGQQYGLFPSIGFAWVLSEEPFIKEKFPAITQFKLRGSYGFAGNDKISVGGATKRFPYMTLLESGGFLGSGGYSFGDYANNSFRGIKEGELGSDNLTWELDHKLNFGTDLIISNVFTLQADVFRNNRTGIFMQRSTLPDVVGNVTAPWGNVGEMQNEGLDASASYTKFFGKDLTVTIRGNFTYTRNKIMEYDEPMPRFPYQGAKGFPYGQLKGLQALGLFKDSADIMSSPVQTFGEVRPGDIKYRDANGDGVINDDDRVPLGYSSVPQIVYGFGSELKYKAFDFAFRFQGASNSDFFMGGYGMYPFIGGETGNVLTIVADQNNRWTPNWYSGGNTENPDAKFPRLTYGNSGNNNQSSSFWLANAKYMRLKEVQMGYTLPPHLLKRYNVSMLRFYATGFNLLVWDKIKLWDPELASGSGTTYPIQRTVTVGIDLRF